MKIIVDAMGGDNAPLEIVRGALDANRNHGVEIHLAGETQSFPISLAEAEALLPAGFFSRCHKSFLVNLAAVEDIGGGELLLRGGERLPVSRAFYRSFQSDLVRYVNRSGGR